MNSVLTAAVDLSEDSINEMMSSLRGLSLTAAIKIIVLAIVLFIVVKLLIKLFNTLIQKSRIDRSLHGFLKNMIRILLYFIAVVILAGSLKIDVTSLIAILSVAGLALSLALQGALSNMASGIVILMAKPLHVGDYIAIGTDEGTVEEINMTYTKLRTYDSRIIFIPNSTVTSSNVINYTIEGKRRVDLVVSASYDCGVDAVKKSLLSAIEMVPSFLPDQEKFARVSGYKDGGIEYVLRAWCRTEDYWDSYWNLVESVKICFDRDGIEMSYTNLNIHVIEK